MELPGCLGTEREDFFIALRQCPPDAKQMDIPTAISTDSYVSFHAQSETVHFYRDYGGFNRNEDYNEKPYSI